MKTNIGVVQFPGSNTERETYLAVKRAGMCPIEILWNAGLKSIQQCHGYIISGGFSFEDRSRAGVIASLEPIKNILKKEIVSLFNKNWKNIYTSKLKPFAQKKGGNFHSKFALDTPEAISIKKGSSEDILLRKIASRNFKSKSFIKIKIDKNTEKYIHLQFSDEGDLSNPE